jgi:hypothetical protein
MSKLSTISIVVLLSCVAACGSGESSSAPDAGGAHAPDGAAPDTSISHHRAQVDVELFVPEFAGQRPRVRIVGRFVASQGPCTQTISGSCEIRQCPAGSREALADPGRLEIPLPAGGEFGWEPGPYPIYFAADNEPWETGDHLTLMGAGSEDVPAFSISALVPGVTDAAPVPDVLDRSMPYHVAWTPVIGPGEVLLTLASKDTPDRPVTDIACAFDASLGAADIPPDVLASLPPSNWPDTEENVWIERSAETIAGDYAVRLRVMASYAFDNRYILVQ